MDPVAGSRRQRALATEPQAHATAGMVIEKRLALRWRAMQLQPAAWAAVLLLGSATAIAAPTGRDRANARALTNEARRAMKNGAYAEAASALERALALDPSSQLKLDLARAKIQIREFVEANELLDELADPALTPNLNKYVLAAVTKLQTELSKKLPRVLVTITGVDPTHAIVELDGKVITPGKRVPVNPGRHAVVADAEGMERATERVTLSEGQQREVLLNLVSRAPAEPASPVETSAGSKIPAAIAFGVGGAGVALGTIFGVMAMSDKSAAEAYCKDDQCTRKAQPSIDSSLTNGNVSTVAFIVGGVGLGLGAVLLLTVGSKKTEQARLVPWIGAGEIGLRGQF
jgi:hypothetical protein